MLDFIKFVVLCIWYVFAGAAGAQHDYSSIEYRLTYYGIIGFVIFFVIFFPFLYLHFKRRWNPGLIWVYIVCSFICVILYYLILYMCIK